MAAALTVAPRAAMLPATLFAPTAPVKVTLPVPALMFKPLAVDMKTVLAADIVKFLIPQASSVFAESRVELKLIV